MSRIMLLTRVLAFIVVMALGWQWELVAAFLRGPVSLLGLVTFVYLALSALSIAGLLRRRQWAFYALYVLVPYGTIMLSVSFLPVPLGFLPVEKRWLGLTLLNGAVLILAALGHYWFRTSAARLSQGAA